MVGSVADGGSTTVGAVGILGPSSPHAADNAAMTPTSSSLFFFRNGHAIPMAIAVMRCRLFRDMVCGTLLLEL